MNKILELGISNWVLGYNTNSKFPIPNSSKLKRLTKPAFT
jgi:hypothetical protein